MRVINPANDQILRELEDDDVALVCQKFERAKAAQKRWSAEPFATRVTAIRKFRELVVQRTEELARTLTSEVGKPLVQARNELKGLLSRIDFFIEHTSAELSDQVVLRTPTEGLEERIAHEPLGVIANISAWNYPYFVAANVFLPALLTGNAVLYKPSEFSTLTGLLIAKTLHESGIPEDLFIPVIGAGNVGKELVEQDVGGVFFTGSYATGQQIAASVAPRMIPLQLELGGKDPAYVTEDVDVPLAAAAIADGSFYNAGQSCCAVERVYVNSAIWDAFVNAFVHNVQKFVIGDPLDERTYIGPLARRNLQLTLLEAQVEDARAKGATVLLGGKRVVRPGHYFEPTVLVNVDHTMRVMTEESFGPIVGVMQVNSDDQARELMADTEYGLTAAVYSKTFERAEAVLSRLDVGSAYWNCCDRVSPRLPWSGRRHSGIGCTLSTYGIRAFLKPKAWHLVS